MAYSLKLGICQGTNFTRTLLSSEQCLKMLRILGATSWQKVPLLEEGVDREEVLVIDF